MRSTTTVINLRGRLADFGPRLDRAPAELLYVGRRAFVGGWQLKASPWANPFPVTTSPEEAVRRYAWRLRHHAALLRHVGELRGRTLACWCVPLPCHARLLALLADAPDPRSTLDAWLIAAEPSSAGQHSRLF